MRIVLFASLVASLIVHGGSVAAQAAPASSLKIAHPTLFFNQRQVLFLEVIDGAGHPVSGAKAVAQVRLGTLTNRYVMTPTDRAGHTSLTFVVGQAVASGRASVTVLVTRGTLRQVLSGTFAVGISTGIGPGGTFGGLRLTARALPATASPPEPVWIVVYARTEQGALQDGVKVSATFTLSGHTKVLYGITHADGMAALRVDTVGLKSKLVIPVSAVGSWKQYTAVGVTRFALRPANGAVVATAASLPTSTPSPTETATATLVPTSTAIPTIPVTSTETPTPTSAPLPIPSSTPTPTTVPTSAPTATAVPTSVPTSTAVPTATSTPRPTSTPTAEPTATQRPNCPGSQDGCIQAMLNIINTTRSQAGLPALLLNATETTGGSNCVGAYGHSAAMADSGTIWHQNEKYPDASFPKNFCVFSSPIGQNVGAYGSGNELTDLQSIHNLMMSEPHDASTCAHFINHACSILSGAYHQVGIGIVQSGGKTWLTEDFLG